MTAKSPSDMVAVIVINGLNHPNEQSILALKNMGFRYATFICLDETPDLAVIAQEESDKSRLKQLHDEEMSLQEQIIGMLNSSESWQSKQEKCLALQNRLALVLEESKPLNKKCGPAATAKKEGAKILKHAQLLSCLYALFPMGTIVMKQGITSNSLDISKTIMELTSKQHSPSYVFHKDDHLDCSTFASQASVSEYETSIKIKLLKKYCSDYQSYLQKQSDILNPEDKKGIAQTKIQKKLNILTKLSNALATPGNEKTKLAAFKAVFNACHPELAKYRDSYARAFLKVLLTVLSLGIAAAFGLWKVEGKMVANAMGDLVSTPKK